MRQAAMRSFPVLAFLFAALVHAQPVEKARIEGSVVSVTGEPIARATIRLIGAEEFSASSDDAGKFVIEDIDPGGNYYLMAQRTGYIDAHYGARSMAASGVPLTLAAGASLKGIVLAMTPQGVVTGRVVDTAGDPVQGVMVALMRRGYQRGALQWIVTGMGSTNDQGEYRIANLPPGRYYLNTSSRNIADFSKTIVPVSTFYPNALDARGAAPIDISAGRELRGIDILLRQGRVFAVRGRAVDASGAPFANATLTAVPKDGGGSPFAMLDRPRHAETRADGSFEILGLSSGAYMVQAEISRAGISTRSMGRAEIGVADRDIHDLVLELSPGVTVAGTVRLEEASSEGIAVTGVQIMVVTRLEGTQPVDVKDDGTFLMENIAPDKVQLHRAPLSPEAYVKSVRFNGADVTHAELDLTSGAGGNLEIVLSNKAANVTGTVTPEKDESVLGITVTLWTNSEVRTATTDQNGSFQFQSLPPGTYYAIAWENIDTGLALALDFLNLMTGDAVTLEVAEGGQSSAQLKIVPTAKIKAAEEKLP